MKLQIDLAGVAEYWPMVDAAANPELARATLLRALHADVRINYPDYMLLLLEHAVRVNGVEVVSDSAPAKRQGNACPNCAAPTPVDIPDGTVTAHFYCPRCQRVWLYAPRHWWYDKEPVSTVVEVVP